MKILVVGASQGTGALATRLACERGHEVTAFARNPQKLPFEHARLTRRVGDFHDGAAVSDSVRGMDAVIITASVTSLKAFKEQPAYFSLGTAHVIAAMKVHAVKRLVVLSAFGVGESRRAMNVVLRTLVVGFLLKPAFEDHARQEAEVRASGLDWVIARPTRLTNGRASRKYVKTAAVTAVPSAISRADVADFLVEAATTETWLRQTVHLGG
jgi:uncharacterized protein YbjT (DUF2867 family)